MGKMSDKLHGVGSSAFDSFLTAGVELSVCETVWDASGRLNILSTGLGMFDNVLAIDAALLMGTLFEDSGDDLGTGLSTAAAFGRTLPY